MNKNLSLMSCLDDASMGKDGMLGECWCGGQIRSLRTFGQSYDIRVIQEVTLSSPWASFHLLSPPYLQSNEILLNLSSKWLRFESNSSSCTGRSCENICSRSGGAQEKGKTG
jgi:hypothetical protein